VADDVERAREAVDAEIGAVRLTFVGTATCLLHLGPFTVLTDPNFLHRGQYAYLGKGLASRRLTEPAMPVEEVPPLDAVVLSHLHGDHFDRVARRGLARTAPVVTTPHAARRLARSGFQVDGLLTWDEHRIERGTQRLTITSVPAVHARGVLGRLLPPVMGSVLTLEDGTGPAFRLYVTGDTLTGGHLDEIADRFPRLDAAVVHLGGTRVLGRLVTLDDVGGVELLRRVEPAAAVPVHYDDYRVFRSPLEDFIRRWSLEGDATATDVRVVTRGGTVPLGAGRGPQDVPLTP
jgi:L-ascorbate metabolism protein UlaG (beta-lactamase superfamily)